jgi:hypothetical protein
VLYLETANRFYRMLELAGERRGSMGIRRRKNKAFDDLKLKRKIIGVQTIYTSFTED